MRILLPLLVLLAGCAVPADHRENSDDASASDTGEPSPDTAEYWLLKREELCSLPELERRARFKLHPGSYAEEEDDRMENLMLASCEPHGTPGLLYEALQDMPPESELSSPPRQALVGLLQDFAQSYRMLETKIHQLEEEMENTIDGIQQIEQDLDGMKTNGEAQ